MDMTSTRRGLLGIMAAAPMVAGAALSASATGRHNEWLRQRDAALAYANEKGIDETEINRRTAMAEAIEDRILDTPPANQKEAVAQLEVIDRLWKENTLLPDHERVYVIVSGTLPFLRGGSN